MYALILAGGKGERLRPLTDTRAKPMAEVNGKPIMWHQVSKLKAAGITDVVVLCGYKWETIRDYFGDGSKFGVRMHYSKEETPLGRGGALRQGFQLVPSTESTVIACNGDVLTDENLGAMIDAHKNNGAIATVMLTPYPSAYGVVETDDSSRITAFREKGNLPLWINGGMYIFDASIAPLLPEIGDHEDSTFPQLAADGKLFSYKTTKFWKAIDNHKDLKEAQEHLPPL